MPLTKSQIDTAKPQAKRYRLTDGGGLVLDVTPAGKKVWRFRYQRNGKDAVVTLGEYPAVPLLDARAKALDLKQSQATGLDPIIETKREAEARRTVAGGTFRDVAQAYMDREQPHWAEGHHKRFRHRMENDIWPVIGDLRPCDIKPVDVTRAIAGIEARGAQNTAVRTAGMVGQVLRYAVAKGLAERDVTADLKGGLDRPAPTQHRPAVTDRDELGDLLCDIWDWPEDSYGKRILQLCAYLFQRPGEIAAMKWADVDLDAALWTYTVTKVGVQHAVPLPTQAVAILQELHQLTGRYDFVFYSRGAAAGHVSMAVPPKLLGKIGWKDKHTAHGFRATARTIIAEDLRVEPRLIEQQLSHTVAEAHGRAYNRTLYIDERRSMVQRYADHLDGLRGRRA